MSLLDVIDDFATSDGEGAGLYLVARRAAGTVTAGRYAPGAITVLEITASVQPFGTNPLIVLPEGARVEDARAIYTATQLYPAPGEPDLVTIGGLTYAVFAVQGPYELDGDVTWIAYAARQDVPGAGGASAAVDGPATVVAEGAHA